MLERCAGKASAVESPIGNLPRAEDLNVTGLNVSADALKALLTVDPSQWRKEVADMRAYLEKYGDRMPAQMHQELSAVEKRLG